jgi:hypothetical protein
MLPHRKQKVLRTNSRATNYKKPILTAVARYLCYSVTFNQREQHRLDDSWSAKTDVLLSICSVNHVID